LFELNQSTILEFVQDIALLGLLAFSLVLVSGRGNVSLLRPEGRFAVAVAFAVGIVLVLLSPVRVPPGSTFDMRAGPALLVGLVGGWLPALLTGIAGAWARYALGGSGALGGAASVWIYICVGGAFARFWPADKGGHFGFFRLTALAAAGTLAALPTFFVGQRADVGFSVLQRAGGLFAFGNFMAVYLLGAALGEVRRIELQRL
jgi:hypothetical protein